MRLNESVCNSMSPIYVGLLNNSNLRRSSSEIKINCKVDSLTVNSKTEVIRISQDTSTYLSLAVTRNNKIQKHKINKIFDNTYHTSSTESLTDFAGYYDDSSQEQSSTDWSEYSEDGNLLPSCRGIINPNYPGFQHLGPSLLSDTDDTEDEQEFEEELLQEDLSHQDEFDNNNNSMKNNKSIVDEKVNLLDTKRNDKKHFFYEKQKFNIQNVSSLIDCMNYVKNIKNLSVPTDTLDNCVEIIQLTTSIKESLQFPEIERISESSANSEIKKVGETILEVSIDLIREVNTLKQPVVCFQSANNLTSSPSNINIDSHSVNATNTITNNINNKNSTVGSSSNNNNNKTFKNYSKNNCNIINCNNSKDNINIKPIENKRNVWQTLDSSPNNTFENQRCKFEEIDLLSSIKNQDERKYQKQQQQTSVPDVTTMELNVIDTLEKYQESDKLVNHDIDSTLFNVLKKEKIMKNQGRYRHEDTIGRRSKKDFKYEADLENGSFDVYNIETAMPNIDMDAIELHLKAAREEERRRRNDREEIRKRLATGSDGDDIHYERGKKPSLQSRLQSGMNLQICFMNETSSDTESVLTQDGNEFISPIKSPNFHNNSIPSSWSSISKRVSCCDNIQKNMSRPQILNLPQLRFNTCLTNGPFNEVDFFTRQARLQIEARMALAQAKEMAHMQMEIERQKFKQNPITDMIRISLQKIGVILGGDRRRLTRALLTELNIAQLQVLANDLHTRIASLNEFLVDGLLRRDDLHMEQDSMLVDVEDLTRYLGAKQEFLKMRQQHLFTNNIGYFHQESRKAPKSQQHQQHSSRKSRTLTLLERASLTRLAAGRQLVIDFVRK